LSPASRAPRETSRAPLLWPRDLVGKQLEVFKEVVPTISRVALLRQPTNPTGADYLREAEAAARILRVRLQTLDVRNPQEIDTAFTAMTREWAGPTTRPLGQPATAARDPPEQKPRAPIGAAQIVPGKSAFLFEETRGQMLRIGASAEFSL